MLVRYAEKPSFYAVGQRLGVHHQTVQRCVERALAYGPLAARATLEQSNRLRVEIAGSLSQSGCPGRCPFDRFRTAAGSATNRASKPPLGAVASWLRTSAANVLRSCAPY